MTRKNLGPAPARGETDVAKLPKLRNILIVVDEYTGGIRDHIRSEIEFLTQNGARVHLFTDRPLIIGEDDGFSSINVLKPSLQGQPWTVSLRGLQQIQSVARAHQIDLIHSHAYSLLPLAALCSKAAQIRIINTFHGPDIFFFLDSNSHGRAFRRQVESIGTLISVSHELKHKLEKRSQKFEIQTVYNPVKIRSKTPMATGKANKWLWAGRLSKDKLPGLRELILMLKPHKQITLDVYGMGSGEDELRTLLESQLGKRGHFLGWKDDVELVFQSYDVISGMGRVIIDGMLSNRPVFLVGYEHPKCFITRENFDACMFANFSGRGLPGIAKSDFQRDLQSLAFMPSQLELSNEIAMHVSDRDVWSKVFGVMEESRPATGSALWELAEWSQVSVYFSRLKSFLARQFGTSAKMQ